MKFPVKIWLERRSIIDDVVEGAAESHRGRKDRLKGCVKWIVEKLRGKLKRKVREKDLGGKN